MSCVVTGLDNMVVQATWCIQMATHPSKPHRSWDPELVRGEGALGTAWGPSEGRLRAEQPGSLSPRGRGRPRCSGRFWHGGLWHCGMQALSRSRAAVSLQHRVPCTAVSCSQGPTPPLHRLLSAEAPTRAFPAKVLG